MTSETAAKPTSPGRGVHDGDTATGGRSRGIGVLTMLTGATGAQVGAAAGAHAFPAIGPIGVVAVRQVVAATILLSAGRPPLHRLTWRQWWPSLVLAAVFATMNLSLYLAIERIGLGLAVTLEFLGPLTVGLLGSRGLRDAVVAAVAATGVYVLVLPGPSSDLVGIGLALLAGTLWALYILVNKAAGQRLPGLQAPAVASLISALMYLPVLVWLGIDGRLWGWPLALSVVAGLLSSALPYATDLTALRFVPAQFFGVFMSVHPVLAALAGLVILGQWLALHEWVGIAIVVVANAVATLRRA